MKNLSKLVLFLFALAVVPGAFADYELSERQVQRLNGSEIFYYLQRPTDAKFPILLIMQGSDCNSVYKGISSFSEFLKKIGVARLDVEKYGLKKDTQGCPATYLENNSIDQRVQDYLRVMQSIRKSEPNWNQELWIAGGSEGAVVASIVVSFVPETKKLVLMASGGGITMRKDMLLLQEKEMRKQGKPEDEIQNSLKQTNELMNAMKLNPVSYKTWSGETNTYKWWASILDILPLNYLVDLSIPIYIVHGTDDIAASVEGSRETAKKFQELHKTNLTYDEYSGLDHHWKDNKGNSHVGEVVEKIFSWILGS